MSNHTYSTVEPDSLTEQMHDAGKPIHEGEQMHDAEKPEEEAEKE